MSYSLILYLSISLSLYLSFVSLSNYLSSSLLYYLIIGKRSPKGNSTQSRWRLSNGSSPAEGRLEYQSEDGDWVCVRPKVLLTYSELKDYFDTICQELGFKQMLSYYKFSSLFLFGSCFGQVYKLIHTGSGVSAIPYVRRSDAPLEHIGLHCSNSK